MPAPSGSPLPPTPPEGPGDHAQPPAVWHLALPDEAATTRVGQRLAQALEPGLVVFLDGPLGVGKTTLVRAILHGLGHTGPVKSPTFTLVEPYNLSRLTIYHFDLYRLSEPQEWWEAGFEEYLDHQAICFIEWPERAAGALPREDLRLDLAWADTGGANTGGDSARQLWLRAFSPAGERCLTALAASS